MALSVMAIVACSHGKPGANLTYVKIAKLQYSYQIDFESDLNVEALFAANHNQKVIQRRFMCALENDHDFALTHTIKRTFDGTMDIGNAGQGLPNGKFAYTSTGDFIETADGGSSYQDLDAKVVRTLLAARVTVPCKLYMTVYMSNPYYSETMFIPTVELLKAVPVDAD